MTQQAQASAQPLPQEAYGYAGMYSLGEPLAVYKVTFRGSIALGIISLLLGGLFAAVLISGEASGLTVVWMSLLFLFCLAGGVYYLILHPLLHGSWRIYGCTEGFIFLKGNEAIACRWDQVAFVWQRVVRHYRNGVYTGTSYKYTVQRSDGVQIVMTEMFRNVGQLGERLQREVTNRLSPQALAAIQAGQTLPFGPFSLSRQGLATSKAQMPWSQVQEVSAKQGLIMIQQRGNERAKPSSGTDKVPNLYVFLLIAEALVKGQA